MRTYDKERSSVRVECFPNKLLILEDKLGKESFPERVKALPIG